MDTLICEKKLEINIQLEFDMTREEKTGYISCVWLCVVRVVVCLFVVVSLFASVWLFGCVMVCVVRL